MLSRTEPVLVRMTRTRKKKGRKRTRNYLLSWQAHANDLQDGLKDEYCQASQRWVLVVRPHCNIEGGYIVGGPIEARIIDEE